jgi:hypothetical protein
MILAVLAAVALRHVGAIDGVSIIEEARDE